MTKLILILSLLTSASAFAGQSWSGGIHADQMSDSKFYSASIQSIKPVWAGKRAELEIQKDCATKKLSIILNHPYILEIAPVQMRFDKSEAIFVHTELSSDLKSLFFGWKDENPTEPPTHEKIVEMISNSKKLLISYSDAGGETFVAEFLTSGFHVQKSKMDAACK